MNYDAEEIKKAIQELIEAQSQTQSLKMLIFTELQLIHEQVEDTSYGNVGRLAALRERMDVLMKILNRAGLKNEYIEWSDAQEW